MEFQPEEVNSEMLRDGLARICISIFIVSKIRMPGRTFTAFASTCQSQRHPFRTMRPSLYSILEEDQLIDISSTKNDSQCKATRCPEGCHSEKEAPPLHRRTAGLDSSKCAMGTKVKASFGLWAMHQTNRKHDTPYVNGQPEDG